MRCESTSDPAEFWSLASGFLLADPVVNNVVLTTVASRRTRPGADTATFAVVRDRQGTVVGAAMRTPPSNVYVTPMPPGAIEPLVELMLTDCPDAAGVTGTVVEAEAFASAWARRSGVSATVHMRERIHRLDSVAAPDPPPGHWRPAGEPDQELLVRWSEAFLAEARMPASADIAASVAWSVAEGRAFLWVDGEPVSYTGTAAAKDVVVRLGPVYTPPAHRGRGYASALVAAVSQRALDAGAAACMLYTDLANPTSNKIYAAVGYRPVRDVAMYLFTGQAGRTSGRPSG